MKKKMQQQQIGIPKRFLVFVLVSLFFWTLIKLSKEYETILSFSVEYINLPQNKLLEKQPLKEIKIGVKGTGFKLLGVKFKQKKLKLSANNLQRKTSSKYYFLLKNQQINIENQFNTKLKIAFFLKDSVFLNLGDLVTKKVPVNLDLTITYKAGFNLSDQLAILPDSITISGPEKNINTITVLNLKKTALTEVAEDISKEIPIIVPENPNLKLSTTNVLLHGKVERFTEGSFYIPFIIENLPKGVTINTFPKKIKVIFKVGLSNFNKIKKNSFKIICDYRFSELHKINHLIPNISSKSPFVKSVKMVPNKIDFLIQK